MKRLQMKAKEDFRTPNTSRNLKVGNTMTPMTSLYRKLTKPFHYTLFIFLSIFLLNFNAVYSVSFLESLFSTHEITQKKSPVLEWAQDRLPHTGVLKQGPDGFVYVKVDDGYIKDLFPLLDYPEYEMPPYFRRPDAAGAHISVFYVFESRKIGDIEELGKTYDFKIKKLALVPEKNPRYIVLEVEAPDLEKLREKYGLSPLLQGHEFHITIAQKPKRHR